MNVENVQALRDFLAALPDERFDMSDYAATVTDRYRQVQVDELKENCGTAACICGWINAVMPGGNRALLGDHTTAADFLGISKDAADELFFADEIDVDRADLTRADAITTLDHLIETGEVDWSVIQ